MEIKKLKDRLHILTTTHKDDVMSDNRNFESDLNLDNDNLNRNRVSIFLLNARFYIRLYKEM